MDKFVNNLKMPDLLVNNLKNKVKILFQNHINLVMKKLIH